MSFYVPLFEALNRSRMRYVVVDGLATVLHGYARLTADVDLVVDLDRHGLTNGIDAMTRFGLIPRLPVDPGQFADPDTRKQWIEERNMRVFSFWNPHQPMLSVDLFVEYPIEFDVLWSQPEVVSLDTVSIRIASIPDLITLKRLANRPQDLIDIEKLLEIQRIKGGS